MSSCKYFFILFALFIPNCLEIESTEVTLRQDEELARKLIALNDTSQFFTQIEKFSRGYGEQWIVMPDGNDQPVLAMMGSNITEHDILRTDLPSEKVVQNVKFFLYTPEHEVGEELDIENLNEIKVNVSKSFKIICHGWMANSQSSVITRIRNAYTAEHDDNVIGVDWSFFSGDFFYPNAAKSTYAVGKHIALLIDNLVEANKGQYKDFHIIGHSLGAHIAGFAGSSTKKKIGRITGLDPALPGFQYIRGSDGRLDRSDATFVDIIHTCSGILGMSVPAGHVDFYPNGGSPFQPGCCNLFFLTSQQACSHSRSHEFFAESINKKSKFLAVRCQDWDHFKRHECEDVYTMMGEYVKKDTSGIFYLTTNEQYPFSKGLNGTIF